MAPSTSPVAGADQDEVLADVQAIDLDHQKIELRQADAIHSAMRTADRATNRRDAADFEVPSLSTAGTSPSGSRASIR